MYRIKEFNKTSQEIDFLFELNNNMNLIPFFTPNFSEVDYKELDKDKYIEYLKSYNSTNSNKRYIGYYNDEPICELSANFKFEMLYKDIPNSVFISISIIESEIGKGHGKFLIKLLEDEIRSLGGKRIELGVFSYNKRAIKFYQNNEYIEIGRLENFTFYNNEWHTDIRFEKIL